MEHSEAQGTLIYEKNLKSKISCRVQFKGTQAWDNFEFFFDLNQILICPS